MNLQEQISRIQSMMGLITESNFKLGDSDDKIEEIQGVLKLEKTGSFNEPTEKCVKEFQTFTNIKIDGIVGPETTGELEKLKNGEIKNWLGCNKTVKTKSTENINNSSGNVLTMSDTWKVPDKAKNKEDALHSFQTRKVDGEGAKILSKIEDKLKELYKKGINPDVYELKINVDSSNYTVKWDAKIGPSKDGKAYVGLSTRGSAGKGSDSRAKSQIPKLMSQLKNLGAEDITEVLNFENTKGLNIRQYFYKYTLPQKGKYPPH